MTLEWHASTHFKSLNVCVRLVRTPSKHYARAHTRRQRERESEQINLITRSYCHVFRWMETRIASFHFVLFCVFFLFFNELRWNTTYIHKKHRYLKMKRKKINFSSSNGVWVKWSQSYSEARQPSTNETFNRNKRSPEKETNAPWSKPTSLCAYIRKYLETLISYRLYCYYFMATPFYSICGTFLGKSIFFGIKKYFPNELKTFLPFIKHIEFLCLSMDWIHFHELFASSFFAKHTAAHALEHCKQPFALTVCSSKQRHNFQFNKFHAAHGLLCLYE